MLRQGKLNSQFIVTELLILHAGGRSNARFEVTTANAIPFDCSTRGAGPKSHIVAVYNLKSEIFEKSENPCRR